MQLLASFHKISIEDIEYSHEWDLHPFLSDTQSASSLHKSVQRVGLLQPPIIRKQSSGKYQLVAGRARLFKFKLIHPKETCITCLVVAENISPKETLSYVLEDQLLSGALTPMEKAYFFSYCLKHMDIDTAAETFLPILSEKVQPHTIKKLSRLLELETELQTSVHYGQIDVKTAYELLNLNSVDRMSLHTIFTELKLGGGKQKRLLALSKDLAYREESTIAELLSKPEFTDILAHPEMNQPQKGAVLLASLQKKLFPQSNSAEESFRKEITKMSLPASCTVTHSLSFEKDAISLTLQFNSLSEMKKRMPEILNLTGD
jgi:ParB family transcriptional regulator, chromosome partitioning protein